MIVRKGAKGPHVKKIQKALHKAGHWPRTQNYTNNFGTITDEAVRDFQEANGLVIDGKVGPNTLKLLGVSIEPETKFDETFKNVTIDGSVLPGKPINENVRVRLNPEMLNEYLPALSRALEGESKGLKLLCTIMAYKEGFRKGTRSYRYNNPGNIGNTDSGANKHVDTLENGVLLQKNYLERIATGQHSAYPMGKQKVIKPYYSPEIARHSKLYGLSPFVPGYKFTFTGQLDQFIKIYSTGARASNGYLSIIISYFLKNGVRINERTTIQEILKIK